MSPSVVVTGAGGYVGGRLVTSLLGEGFHVLPIVRQPVEWLPVAATVLDLAAVDEATLVRAFDGHDAVVHLAGPNEVESARTPDTAMATTLAAARRVAAAARSASVGRLVVASTVHVYGAAAAPRAVLTTATVPQPRHPYAIARLGAEHLAAANGPDDLVVLRLTNAVGAPADPRVDRWTLVANDLCRQAVERGELRLTSTGEQFRDFVALHDVLLALCAGARGDIPPGTYNLGSGTATRVLDLASLIADVATEFVGARIQVDAPPPTGDAPAASVVDVAPLAAVGLVAATPLRDAVRETLLACVSGPPS
ncbi:MAG: NAD-dependent epimerase/dehydratase family protein [Microthrixaceae bacterium]